ncbi:MAG TPA: ABC transporter permease, partial [Puia sp.]|nr:ABC transporter permease [Puia sp.]
MLKNFFLTSLRSLQKNGLVNWINITGLAAGMTSAVLVFLWVQNELTFDNYHPQADRIFRTTAHLKKAHWVWSSSPYPLAAAIREGLPEIEQSARVSNAGGINFHIGEEYFAEKQAAYVDKNWFGLFHYDFVSGSTASFLQHPYSLILSETKAKKYFGKKDPIGQTIRIDTVDYRVQAVIKDNPANSSFQWDVLLPMEPMLTHPDQRDNATKFNNFNCLTFLKLRAGADPKKLGAKITSVLLSHKKDSDVDMDVIPLKEMHFETGLTSSGAVEHADKKTVYIFSILGIFLLIIACINYVNLTTARASLRAKEVSVRKIVGAGKKSLFAQFIIESLLISTVSVLITLLLVRLSLPWYRDLTGKNFADPLLSAGMWKIIGVTLLSATILNGIYPAMLLSSFQPLNVFKGVSILKVKDAWFRKSLVVVQFTFSVILIISTILIHQQLNYVQNTNPGYERAQLFSFHLPWQTFRGKSDEETENIIAGIKQQLLAQTSIPGVASASGSTVQVGSSNSGSADWDGHDTTYQPTVYQLSVDEDYRPLLRIEMQQGHWFQPNDPIDRHNFVLNETAVNLFNIRKPVLGQRFTFQGDTGKIIGVAKDFHFASLH